MKFRFQNFHKYMKNKFYLRFPCTYIIFTKMKTNLLRNTHFYLYLDLQCVSARFIGQL